MFIDFFLGGTVKSSGFSRVLGGFEEGRRVVRGSGRGPRRLARLSQKLSVHVEAVPMLIGFLKRGRM